MLTLTRGQRESTPPSHPPHPHAASWIFVTDHKSATALIVPSRRVRYYIHSLFRQPLLTRRTPCRARSHALLPPRYVPHGSDPLLVLVGSSATTTPQFTTPLGSPSHPSHLPSHLPIPTLISISSSPDAPHTAFLCLHQSPRPDDLLLPRTTPSQSFIVNLSHPLRAAVQLSGLNTLTPSPTLQTRTRP